MGFLLFNRYLRILKSFIALTIAIFFIQFPAAQAQSQETSVSDLLDGLGVPGIDSLNLTGVTTGTGWTAGSTTLYGETVTVVVFTQSGFDKKVVAVLPQSATLASFLPIGSGTPLSDLSFDDLAFIYVAAGESGTAIDTSSFPTAVSTVLSDYGDTADLHAGFNFFGTVDLSGSGATVSLLVNKLHLSETSLPISQVFTKDLLSENPATMGATLMDEIINSVDISVAVSGVSIANDGYALTFSDTNLTLKGDTSSTKKVDIGISGNVELTVAGTDISMDVDVTFDPGADSDIAILGTSAQTFSMDIFHNFEFTELTFDAYHQDGGWPWAVQGATSIHGEPVHFAFHKEGQIGITTPMTLAQLIGKPSTPGLKDVSLDTIYVHDETIEVDATVKGVEVDMYIYRPTGAEHSNVGIAATDNFTLSTFVSQAAGTLADDGDFENVAMIWVPSTGTVGAVDTSSLPTKLGAQMSSAGSSVTLTTGLNFFGELDITTGGNLESLLTDLNIPTTTSLPLNGGMSAKIFSNAAAGAVEAIETDILNALNLTIPLSGVSLSEGPASISFSDTVLNIKGDTSDGNKLVVDVTGDMDTTLDGTSVDMALELTYEHGASPDMTITGSTTTPITFDFFKSFDVSSASFTATRSASKWTTQVTGSAELNSQTVDVSVDIDPTGDMATFTTTSTLAALIGESNIPGLDDVIFDTVKVAKGYGYLEGSVNGVNTQITSFKRGPGNKTHIGVHIPSRILSVASFIPQLSTTPINDIQFTSISFLWVPTGAAEQNVATSSFPGSFGTALSAGLPTANLKPGVLMNGYLEIGASPKYKAYMTDLGIPTNGQYINGTIDKAALHPNLASAGSTVKDAVLDNLDLHFNVSVPNIPGLDDVLTVRLATATITGKLNASNVRVIDIGVDLKAALTVGSDTLAFDMDIEDVKKSDGTSELTLTATSDQTWTKPLGIQMLTLDDVGLTITKTTTGVATSHTDYTFALASTFEVDKVAQEVTTSFEWVNGAITDGSFTFAGPLALSDIPGIKDLPNASEFSISSLTVSTDGVAASTSLHGNTLDFYAFEVSDSWNFAAVQKNFEISELIPLLDNTPAGDFKLSEAAVMVSDGGISGSLSTMPLVAQNALSTIYGSSSAEVNIASGLSMVASFGSGTTTVGKAMSRMGAGSGGVLIGTIGGVFGGTPDVSLTIEMDVGAKPQHKSGMTSMPDGEQLSLTVTMAGGPASFVGSIGTTVDVTATIHKDTLVFGSTVAIQLSDEDVRLIYAMSLKTGNLAGKPLVWHEPYGIPGFMLNSVTIDLGIDEDGAQHFGFAGDFTAAKDTISFAVDFDLTPETLEFPTDIAFQGSADYIEMDFLEAVAFNMLSKELKKKHVDLGISSLPVPKIEGIKDPKTGKVGKAKIAFVSPGAQDPNLGITSMGVGLQGSMHWLGQDLGELSVSIGPESGIFIWGDIADVDFGSGLFKLEDNNFAMRVPMPGLSAFNSPVEKHSNAACKKQKGLLFCINANIDVIGIKEDIRVDATSEGMSFSASQSFGKYFNDTIKFALTGVDLTQTHPSLSNIDFAMSGTLKAEVGKEIESLMKASINNIFDGLGTTLKKGTADIKKDTAKVNKLTREINKQRAIVRAAKQKVEHAVTVAQDYVNKITNNLNTLWYHYHHCSGWDKYFCKGRYGLEIGVEKGIKDAADGILDAAKALVSHVPVDLSPTVWPLMLARKTADGVLYLAEESIKGLSDLTSWAMKAIDQVENYVGNSVNIKSASFNGSLKGIIATDQPVDLAIKAEIFGTNFSDSFAFNIGVLAGDVENDFKQLALMGYYGIDHLLLKVMSDIPKPLKSKIRGAIGKLVDGAQASNRRVLATYATDFASYGKTAVKLQSTYSDFADSYAYTQMTNVPTPLDRLPHSETLTAEVIEIGNSGYCLSSPTQSGSMGFDACASSSQSGNNWNATIKDQKLTTQAVMKSSKDTGYVSIHVDGYQGAQCLNLPGKWTSGEVTYGANTVYEQIFTPSTQYGAYPKGAPAFSTCSSGTENNNWKILKHGDRYNQIINRATQTCLYMEYPTAAEIAAGNGQTKLSLISCVGADTQIFKLAAVEQPTHHLVGTVLKKSFLPSSDQGIGLMGCVGGDDGANGFGVCANNSSQTLALQKENGGPYNVTWNYFEDYLSRRRFVATKPTGDIDFGDGDSQSQSICLSYGVNDNTDLNTASFPACDATEESQWLVYNQVVGGFTLNTISSDVNDGFGMVALTRYPDPANIFTMPLNPVAGIQWTAIDYNNSSSIVAKNVNGSYAATDQTNAAILARATSWNKIKTSLLANKATMAEGNQYCINKSALCYMEGSPTSPFVSKSGNNSTPYGLASLSIPAGATGLSGGMPVAGGTPSSSSKGATFGYLTNGTMIITDDLSASSATAIAAYSGTPAAPVPWVICQAVTVQSDNEYGTPYTIPGLMKNQSCDYRINQPNHQGTQTGQSTSTIMHKIVDVFWQPAGSGYLPAMAIPTGRVQLNTSGGFEMTQFNQNLPTKALFSCRSMINRESYIGWTYEGKFCHVNYSSKLVVTRNFEVLTLNGSLAEAKPPAPICTQADVQNYLNQYQQDSFFGGGNTQWFNYNGSRIPGTKDAAGFYANEQYYCTPAQYNKQNPGCDYSANDGGCQN